MQKEITGVDFSLYVSSNPSSKKHSSGHNLKSRQAQEEQDGIDFVAQDKIWREYVYGENHLVKEWEKNWGFLAKFDSKGMLKTEKELPDKLNMFSNTLPNTSSGSYGAKLESPVGRQILNLEFKFYGSLRRKRTEDLLCC
ncbi:uncharacterized protein C2orf50 homolog isoform X1 [Octopus sinensis]|uniref:Uncharacterized protein C2orf50 homolog isoform X1 n=1 Tax=Octopus sinensis TaxID=2607531 RepID=A0A6P7SSE2_9MOLL|nr:uncharacterized protein C2orf50 homolog isoform X1 [Octopus sinensis]